MNQSALIILLILAGLAIAALVYFLARKQKPIQDNSGQAILMMQEQLKEIRSTLDMKLGESTKAMQEQSTHTINIVKEITEELTRVVEGQKQVVNFADQLQDLQDILKNPKQRGLLGEYYLETVLKNVLPPNNYQMQYKFKDGIIVDAVIFFGKEIIPVDSKFSLENYNRILEERDVSERERLEKLFKQDLKNRIDETSKYIRPEEGTTEYAFMFIPAEAIYYDLLINQIGAVKINTSDLIGYANREKHVIIVSPTTFHVYLRLFLEGLSRTRISETVKEVIKQIGYLGKHIVSYDNHLQRLGNNLGTTINTYNSAYKEFKKIDKDVARITGDKSVIEPLQVERPNTEEIELEE